jgi:hypothetical protein
MPPANTTSDTEATDPLASQKRPSPSAVADPFDRKKPAERSNERDAADYLLDQNRIGCYNSNPYRKHKFITLRSQRLFDQLVALYTHFLKANWTHFSRALDHNLRSDKAKSSLAAVDYAASVYISHWFNDLYYTNRVCTQKVDGTAFIAQYYHENALHSNIYDHFLSLLNAAIRPTHIHGISDEIYIPVIAHKAFADLTAPFNTITGYVEDYTTFKAIIQIMDARKVCKLTPLSSDITGRPSWLFDWFDGTHAYAWFQQDGNYNDIDIAVAYVIGASITPLLGHNDTDEWVIYPPNMDEETARKTHTRRVYRKVFSGLAEVRTLQSELIELPNYYETDKAKRIAGNIGPIALYSAASSSSAPSEFEDQGQPISAPPSPTYSKDKPDSDKAYRVRTIDFIYYAQVVRRIETSTRLAAFSHFMRY